MKLSPAETATLGRLLAKAAQPEPAAKPKAKAAAKKAAKKVAKPKAPKK